MQFFFAECRFVLEGRASNFEAHNLAKHMISYGVGRHFWLGTPYSITVHVPANIMFDQ